jgi:hypothetical protein
MRMEIKLSLASVLFIFVFLGEIGLPSKICVGETKKATSDCPPNDQNVRVAAKIRSVKLENQDEDEIDFVMHTHIRISNVSTKQVLIFVGDEDLSYPGFIGVLLAKGKSQALSCQYIYDFMHGDPPSIFGPYIRKKIDHETPPEDVFRRIEPKGRWEFDRDVGFIISKHGFETRYEGAWDKIHQNPHVWLQLQLTMLPYFPELQESDFLKNLQERWNKNGHLVIIRHLYSEPIKLTLPVKRGSKSDNEEDL